jgi:hypothetical protein
MLFSDYFWLRAVQVSMIAMIGMSFLPLYQVIGPLIFFMPLLMIIRGGCRFIVLIFLREAIITRYCGCPVWVFAAF